MAQWCGSASPDQQVEPIVQALDELIEAKGSEADRREFDGQGDPVQAARQLDDGGSVARGHLEGSTGLSCSLDEQGDRLPLRDPLRASCPSSSGTDNGPTWMTVSPATPSGCLLVARIRRPGASRRSASESTAQASIKCSQLSRTSRSRLEAT